MTRVLGRPILATLIALFTVALTRAGEEPVFSGPQPGEKLPGFSMKGVLGDDAGKQIDPVARADGKPVLIVFCHERTRPAFGLTNTITRFAASRAKDGLVSGVCFLTGDATSLETWMGLVSKYFTAGVPHGISVDGAEGPGAYGLNRNVTLTVLVGKEGRVTDNFALVQPSLQADGPKIFKAIVGALGGGDVPDVAAFSGQQPARGDRSMQQEEGAEAEIRPLLRRLINQEATPEEVDRAAAAVEQFVAKNAAAKTEIGRISRTIVQSGKLENYGTEKAQEYLRQWARKYGGQSRPQRSEAP